ncbi:MAG: RNA polymerase sigma factor RpoD/SigA [Methylovulum sp.]|nr:RNA polymerase sigma factor RpoD/SigA [Methylovulum sp.]
MAYLTEQLSRQKSGLVVDDNEARAAGSAPVVDRTQDGVEQGNFEIARNLKDQKDRLIEALSHFPVVALWLLNEHEKSAYVAGQEEDDSLVSDLATALDEIKNHYLSAGQSFTNQNHATFTTDTKQLVSALQRFPFSFDDLTKITDVIVYACHSRALCDAPPSNPSDVLASRLASLKRRSRLSRSKLSDLFTAIAGNEEDFLFLSRSDMHNYATEMVIAEQLWLNARQELAKANTRLVLFIANQYKAGFLDFDDLVQEGQAGLLKAVDKFDYRLGFQFSTYAGYWIRQAISRSLSRCERLVRVPCGQVANINKVYRAKNEMTLLAGVEPSINELADYTKLSHNEINSILTFSQTVLSLESSDDDEEGFAPIDFLEQQTFAHPFKSIAEVELGELLSKAIETLNPREAKVICGHFGVDTDREMTLREIGSELNLTRERVRQIQVVALNKIKVNFGQQLMCFL